jgi:hypothetical protein
VWRAKRQNPARESLTISAKLVGAGAVSQPWILRDERSGLLTPIAATESVWLRVRMKRRCLSNWNRRFAGPGLDAFSAKTSKGNHPGKGQRWPHKVEKALLCEDFHGNSAWQFPENDNEKQRGLTFYT